MGGLSGEGWSISATDVGGVSTAGEEKPVLDGSYNAELVETDVCSVLAEPGQGCRVDCRRRGNTAAAGTFRISLSSIVILNLLVSLQDSTWEGCRVPRKGEA